MNFGGGGVICLFYLFLTFHPLPPVLYSIGDVMLGSKRLLGIDVSSSGSRHAFFLLTFCLLPSGI